MVDTEIDAILNAGICVCQDGRSSCWIGDIG